MMVELAGLYLRSYPPTVETLDVLKVKVVFLELLTFFRNLWCYGFFLLFGFWTFSSYNFIQLLEKRNVRRVKKKIFINIYIH